MHAERERRKSGAVKRKLVWPYLLLTCVTFLDFLTKCCHWMIL